MAKNDRGIRCSFCGKPQTAVKKMIAGPSGIYICDECIKVCESIIETDNMQDYEDKYTLNTDEEKLPTPEEIKNILDEYVIGQDEAKRLFQ